MKRRDFLRVGAAAPAAVAAIASGVSVAQDPFFGDGAGIRDQIYIHDDVVDGFPRMADTGTRHVTHDQLQDAYRDMILSRRPRGPI